MKNMMPGKILAATILCLLSSGFSTGQNLNVKRPEVSPVYLHTDRSVYNSGETVMFDAFILNDLSDKYKSTGDTLLLALIDQNGVEVASETLPVSGFSTKGSLELSKYLNEGNYVLVAGTDKMKDISPDVIFSKILEINNPKISSSGIRVTLDNSLYKPGDNLRADIFFSDKNREPVSGSFSYSLTNSGGEMEKGKGKADKSGHSVINISLPAFTGEETLTLLLTASVKGGDVNTGIVIPTEGNSKKLMKYSDASASGGKNLVLVLTTDKKEYRKSEEVTGYITVTNKQQEPLYASLSVSASAFEPQYYPLSKDNIITCSNLKSDDSGLDLTWCGLLKQLSNKNYPSFRNYSLDNGMLINSDIAESFGKALATFTHMPGQCFLVENKNDLKKIERKQAAKQKAEPTGYSADRNIFDIINRIRPFQLVNNTIMFSNVGNYSINFQGGAMIVIDGVKRGTDASILNNIPITDIAKVTATTNPSELQRYSALNSSGLVEITTKKGYAAANKPAVTEPKESSNLFWKPDLNTDTSGKAKITFRNDDEAQDVLLTVEGITSDGLTGSASISYKVK